MGMSRRLTRAGGQMQGGTNQGMDGVDANPSIHDDLEQLGVVLQDGHVQNRWLLVRLVHVHLGSILKNHGLKRRTQVNLDEELDEGNAPGENRIVQGCPLILSQLVCLGIDVGPVLEQDPDGFDALLLEAAGPHQGGQSLPVVDVRIRSIGELNGLSWWEEDGTNQEFDEIGV